MALREVWHARELLYFLIWRDVKVRYKQTVLGIAWALVQPFLTMVIFTLLFGRLGRMPSDGMPYPLFSFSGLVPWTYFASAMGGGANSLAASRYLIAKVYFPRLLVPLAAVLMPGIDMLIALGMLIVLMVWYGVVPSVAILLLPLLLVLLVMTALSIVLWTSALTVHYRDMRYLIPFAVQMLFFLTPVAYSGSTLPGQWRVLYGLNPMTTVVEGFRAVMVGGPPPGPMAFVSIAIVIIMFFTGVAYFRSVESSIVDLI